MWKLKTVKGFLNKDYIITEDGKYMKLVKDSLVKRKGYFLVKRRGIAWDLLRILKIKDDQAVLRIGVKVKI